MHKDLGYLRYTIFILGILLIPSKSYYLFFTSLVIWVLLFLFTCRPILSTYSKILLCFILFISVSASLRFIVSLEPNIRDFIEAFRFVPLLLVLLFRNKLNNIHQGNFINAFLIYAVIDAVVSFLQFTNNGLFSIVLGIARVYNADHHVESSLVLTHRTLGLSTGPGDHGSLMLMLLCYFISMLVTAKTVSKWKCTLGILFTCFSLVTSQSRTAFLALVVVITLLIGIFLVLGNLRKRLYAILVILVLLGFSGYVFTLLQEYQYLFSLFLHGTEINSYRLREEKWAYFFSLAIENPWMVFSGFGKEYFGADSAAMDSDYVYVFLVYGIIVFFAFACTLLRCFYKLLIKGRIFNNPFDMAILLILSGGLILSLTSSFFTDPRISSIVGLLFIASYYFNLKITT